MAENKVIAGFELLEKVGQGGMGVVFKARQVEMHRDVALKILHPKLAKNEKFKARFLRAARLCARLNHPNIINGIDCGEDGAFTYFAMEFVDGRTIRQILKEKGRLPIKDAVAILRQTAEALAYIHKNSMVHRDVKPDNIMLDSMGAAKLCDLGLAKLSQNTDEKTGDGEGAVTDDPALTRAGQVVGTPYYIAPEVARGSKDVDIRADIYCLGATFYHIATGWVPFEAKNSKAVMKRHVQDETFGLCERNKEVPEAWGWIVSKMMAKSPEDRYRDPKELLADIDAAAAGRPVSALGFKAKSSCAPPPRAGKRSVSESKPSMPKAVSARRAAAQASAEESSDDEPEVRATRPVRAVARRHDWGMLAGLAAGVIAAFFVWDMLAGAGSGNSETRPRKKPPGAATSTDEPAPPPLAASSAADNKTRAPSPSAVASTGGGSRAQQALDAALALEKKSPDNYAELFPAFADACMLTERTPLSAAAEEAQKNVEGRWSEAFDAAVKPMREKASGLAAKHDFAAALAAINADSVPENLRAAGWNERLDKLRTEVADSADSAAAALLKDAGQKAAAGDARSLAAAIELASKAETAGAESRSAAKAAAQIKEWRNQLTEARAKESAARNEKLAAAAPLVPALRARIAASLRRNDFAAAQDLLNKAAADKQFAAVPALIEKEKEDVAALQELRRKAIGNARASGGKTDVLDAADVDAHAPPVNPPDSEDLRRHALLFMAAGVPGRARDYFNRAKEAGLTEPLDGYLRYVDIQEYGEKEVAAREAWSQNEKLYTDKKFPELKIAYAGFQKEFAGTKTLNDQTATIKTRMAEIDGAQAPQPAATPAAVAGAKPDAEAPPSSDAIFLSDMQEVDSHVGVKELCKKGKMPMTTPAGRITVNGDESPNGLFTHPPSTGKAFVMYKLTKQYKTLTGAAAIDDASSGLKSPDKIVKGKVESKKNSLQFRILGDGKVLWETSIGDAGRPESFEVDISTVEKLELVVECKASNSGAYAVWVEPKLVK